MTFLELIRLGLKINDIKKHVSFSMSLENTEIIEKLYKENDLIKIKNFI